MTDILGGVGRIVSYLLLHSTFEGTSEELLSRAPKTHHMVSYKGRGKR